MGHDRRHEGLPRRPSHPVWMLSHRRKRPPILEVQPTAKGAPTSCQHDDLARVVECHLVEGIVEFPNELEIDGIETFGPGKHNPRDPFFRVLDFDHGHGIPPRVVLPVS